ncbi:MAG: hypothetical protein QF737_05175 [Dehalococcoidales bacterium]|jgi:hypothetical protein|nr:hypothetical protein [Dehalococcoidales bacterium]MDP7410106.1 hypothetical protein [Dehalococcoidales bacterium]|tara:strand:+ start:78 stop:233 length:156 start_codon:yes stop_codon:yes gene_type:complete
MLNFRHSFMSIFIGIFIAATIVTSLSFLGWAGATIAGIGLASLTILRLWKT